MKLFATILFAFANAQDQAQGGGRVRDKDVGDLSASFDSYNAGFGDDSYGDLYSAFADAFGDSGNYDAYGYDATFDATASPDAAEAGRPVEVVEEDVKTVLTDGLDLVASNPDDTNFNQYCWVGVGSNQNGWLTGSGNNWQLCNGGEHQACEVKVVRDLNNAIIQIVSKCANQESCTDNMRQNFSPEIAGGSMVLGSYAQQQCRPQNFDGVTGANFGAREKRKDSTCFFCIEPCDAVAATRTGGTQAELQAANCVGFGSEANTKPISGSSLDIAVDANDASVNVAVYDGTSDVSPTKSINWYQTILVTLNKSGYIQKRTISRIQHKQLKSTTAAGVVTE